MRDLRIIIEDDEMVLEVRIEGKPVRLHIPQEILERRKKIIPAEAFEKPEFKAGFEGIVIERK